MPGQGESHAVRTLTMVSVQVMAMTRPSASPARKAIRAERFQACDDFQLPAFGRDSSPTLQQLRRALRPGIEATASRSIATSTIPHGSSPRSTSKIGYDNAAQVAKAAHKAGISLREPPSASGFVTRRIRRPVRPRTDPPMTSMFLLPRTTEDSSGGQLSHKVWRR